MDLTKNVNEIITDMAAAIDNLKEQILQAVYPVGSVYVSITDSRNPAVILGFGTWEALPAGYGLVAQGTATAEDGSTLTFTAGEKSGEFKHQLSVGELPNRIVVFWCNTGSSNIQNYAIVAPQSDTIVPNQWGLCNILDAKNYGFPAAQIDIGNRHNNLSPSVSAYVWKRVS